MFTNKKQLKRDLLLIGILILIVGIIFVLYYSLKEEAEVAVVSYDNTALFEIDMENGVFKGKTTSYNASVMPEIKGENLYVGDELFTSLKEGDGVLVFNDNYFVKGKLGYVKIQYNPTTKKIRVVEETSPYNICSNQGYSSEAPIVCLPNYVSIKFSKSELDEIV